MEIKDFFKRRDLIKIPLNKEKIKQSINISDIKLEESQKLFNSDFFNSAVLSTYNSMFQAARALLYSKGIQEKSHFATYFYIKEEFSNKIPKSLILSFNHYRDFKYELLYGNPNFNKEETENIILDAEDWLNEIKKVLEK